MKLRPLVINLLLLAASVTAVIGGLEVALRYGLFSRIDEDSPVSIPPTYREENKEINNANNVYANRNCWQFTDIDHPIAKPAGVKRVMVIGDSFIWGDGLPYNLIWSHRLSAMLDAAGYDDIQVLSCGRCGWSTKDELEWLEEYGYRYGIDLLLVSWTSNDPELYPILPGRSFNCAEWPVLSPIREVFPAVFDLVTSRINEVVNAARGSSDNWFKMIYSPSNLESYRESILRRFRSFADEHGIKLLFVMVPRDWTERYADMIDRVTPLLEECEIEYLNLYPSVRSRLSHIPVKQLWSNPANPHPGSELHQVYTDGVFRYIEDRRFLRSD